MFIFPSLSCCVFSFCFPSFVFCRYCLFNWPFSSFPLLFQFSIDILSSPKPTPLLSLYFLINSVLLVPFKFLTQDSGIGFLYLSLLVLLKFFGKIYSLWKISLIAQLVKNPPKCRWPQFDSWVRKIHWRRDRLSTPVFLGFTCVSAGKESASNAGDLGSIPGLGRSPGEGKSYPHQYSGLENSMDYTVHGVTKSRTRLSDFYFSLSQSMRIFNMVWLD